jgi:DNA-binding IclR family transcriptional regulator
VHGAIRVALTVPKLRTRDALATHFALPHEQVQATLHFLEEIGLAERKGESYFPTSSLLHLGNDSPHIVRHHTNWRLRALDAVGHEKPGDLHFSGIWSLSAADRRRIRALLVDCLERSQGIAKASPEEELAIICVDLFSA